MKMIFKIIIVILSLNLYGSAQILECVSVENPKIGLQLAKYKFEKLKTKNGIEYIKGGYNLKHNYTIFSAVTHLGIERIILFNKSEYVENVEMFKAISNTEFKNGMNKETELLCYDLKEMNKKRVSMGNQPSQITLEDYK